MKKRHNVTDAEKQRGFADLLINASHRFLPYLQSAILIYVIILTFPGLIIETRGDLDYSWYVGLHKAAEQGFTFGRDIVFTYGPLGFLTVPIFINKTLWVYSALYTLTIYALIIFACSLFIRKTKANLAKTIIFAIIFVAIFKGLLTRPGRDFELLLILLIFSYLYIISKRNLIWLLSLAFFCSVLPYIKFSSVAGGGITAAVFILILILNKRRNEAVVFLSASFVSFCILGLLLIGHPKAVYTYIYGCLQIADGYNDAMGVTGTQNSAYALASALFSWIYYTGLLFYCALRKRRDDLIFLVLSFGVLFLNFKLGFVRKDSEHTVFFYSMWMTVFTLFFLKSSAVVKIARYSVLIFIAAMLFQCFPNVSSFINLYAPLDAANKTKNLRLGFNLSRGIGAEEQIANVKKQLAQHLFLAPFTVNYLSGHTMDIFPWDIGIVEAYGFNWTPRPVFQSYSAYTPYLDSLNAKYFSSDSSPQYIIYAYNIINRRYQIFDEPATFRTLLQKYKPVGMDGDYMVLRKTPSANIGKEVYVSTEVRRFRDIIPVPQLSEGLIFAKIRMEHNFLGEIARLFYKPPNVYFTFFKNRKYINNRMYRFIYNNATNGVLVSGHIKNQDDLLKLWKGDIQRDIDGIAFFTPHPAFYKKKITIEFFTITPAK